MGCESTSLTRTVSSGSCKRVRWGQTGPPCLLLNFLKFAFSPTSLTQISFCFLSFSVFFLFVPITTCFLHCFSFSILLFIRRIVWFLEHWGTNIYKFVFLTNYTEMFEELLAQKIIWDTNCSQLGCWVTSMSVRYFAQWFVNQSQQLKLL